MRDFVKRDGLEEACENERYDGKVFCRSGSLRKRTPNPRLIVGQNR